MTKKCDNIEILPEKRFVVILSTPSQTLGSVCWIPPTLYIYTGLVGVNMFDSQCLMFACAFVSPLHILTRATTAGMWRSD